MQIVHVINNGRATVSPESGARAIATGLWKEYTPPAPKPEPVPVPKPAPPKTK